jgi:hypothetical protein
MKDQLLLHPIDEQQFKNLYYVRLTYKLYKILNEKRKILLAIVGVKVYYDARIRKIIWHECVIPLISGHEKEFNTTFVNITEILNDINSAVETQKNCGKCHLVGIKDNNFEVVYNLYYSNRKLL